MAAAHLDGLVHKLESVFIELSPARAVASLYPVAVVERKTREVEPEVLEDFEILLLETALLVIVDREHVQQINSAPAFLGAAVVDFVRKLHALKARLLKKIRKRKDLEPRGELFRRDAFAALRREDDSHIPPRQKREAVVAEFTTHAAHVKPDEERGSVGGKFDRKRPAGGGRRPSGHARFFYRRLAVRHKVPLALRHATVGAERKNDKLSAATCAFGNAERRKPCRSVRREHNPGLARHGALSAAIGPVLDLELAANLAGRVVKPVDLNGAVGPGTRDNRDRLEETPRHILKRFPLAAVFDRRPARHRPVVVKLPEKRSHASRHGRAPPLDRGSYSHTLLELRKDEFAFKILRLAEIPDHRLAYAPVAAGVFLVPLEVVARPF